MAKTDKCDQWCVRERPPPTHLAIRIKTLRGSTQDTAAAPTCLLQRQCSEQSVNAGLRLLLQSIPHQVTDLALEYVAAQLMGMSFTTGAMTANFSSLAWRDRLKMLETATSFPTSINHTTLGTAQTLQTEQGCSAAGQVLDESYESFSAVASWSWSTSNWGPPGIESFWRLHAELSQVNKHHWGLFLFVFSFLRGGGHQIYCWKFLQACHDQCQFQFVIVGFKIFILCS